MVLGLDGHDVFWMPSTFEWWDFDRKKRKAFARSCIPWVFVSLYSGAYPIDCAQVIRLEVLSLMGSRRGRGFAVPGKNTRYGQIRGALPLIYCRIPPIMDGESRFGSET
jgi:hypothetical protein